MKVLRFGMIACLMTASLSAMALPAMLGVFKTTYKIDEKSNIGKANCKICHSTGTKLNPYGLDVKAALKTAKTKTLSDDILKKIESLDSNKNGIKNLAEITADKLPGAVVLKK